MVVDFLCGGDELKLDSTYKYNIMDFSAMVCRAIARAKSKQKHDKHAK